MELKILPKEALAKIDVHIKQGFEILQYPPVWYPEVETEKELASSNYVPSECDKWFERGRKLLDGIFSDFSFVYRFAGSQSPVLDTGGFQKAKNDSLIYDEIKKGLDVLVEIKKEIQQEFGARNIIDSEAAKNNVPFPVPNKTLNGIDDKSFLIFTEDGKLLHPGCEPIFNLTQLQRDLCKTLFEKHDVNRLFQTIDLEKAVYRGEESTKQRQAKFKKLVERVNKIIKSHFKIPEAIRYGTDTTRRLV